MFNSLSHKLIVVIVLIALASMLMVAGIARQRIFNGFDNFRTSESVKDHVKDNPSSHKSDNGRPPPPRNSFRRFVANTAAGIFEDAVFDGLIRGAAFGLLMAIVAAIIFARHMTDPLRKLTAATHRLAKGELGHQVKISTNDEFGELATAFNRMSADLARSNQLREQMTADIAHDLRTPLTVIAGYTEALSDGKLQGSPSMYQVMQEQVQHLQHLLDGLRTLSLVDAGELRLHKQKTLPTLLLERTAVAHVPQAEEKGVQLVLDVAENLPFISVDVERMVQVLNNLVSNALRFTPEGGMIRLVATTDQNSLIVSVQDTGVGIASDELANIFERTYRTDSSRQRSGGETGLGLAIVKSIVEAHGGRVEVESAMGNGATFTIRLPI